MPTTITKLTVLILILGIVSLPNISNYLPKSQVLAQSVSDQRSEADRLYQQGKQQVQKSQYQAALQSFEQALKVYRQIKARSSEALTINYIALAENQLGNHLKALDLYQQALTIFKELDDRWNEGTTLNNLGIAYVNMSRYNQALELFQQALAVRQEVNDKEGEGVTLNQLGLLYQDLGDKPQALRFFQQALILRKAAKDSLGEALTLNALGLYYRNLEQYPQAIEHYEQALTIFKQFGVRKGEATILNNLGDIQLNQNQYLPALKLFQQALNIYKEIGDRASQGTILGNIARVYATQGQTQQALEFFQKALVTLRDVNDRLGQARQLKNRGNTLYQDGKLVEAERNLRDGIEVFESLREKLSDANKVSIFETQATTYRLLQKVLIAQNKTNEALEISERSRSRALVELLLQKSSTNIDFKSSIKVTSIEEIKRIAKEQKATLIEYAIVPAKFSFQNSETEDNSNLYIWVVKPTGEINFRVVDIKLFLQQKNTSLKELVTTSRESLGVRGIFDTESPNPIDEKEQLQRLKSLYNLLIEPVADLMPTDPNQRVIFMPQSELFLVPFPALQDQQGKYLIEKHTIVTSPSIQVLELTHKQRDKVKQAALNDTLVLGNPTMPSVAPKIGDKPKQLTNLPGAKREAEAIAPLLNTKILTGDEATKANVLARLPQAKYVHLATHGLFDDFQGLQSAIALAPTQTDNGLLTAEEVLNLKLNAELVVLSACNTGRGRITGDGVIGISRAFISAGVPSVIVSLWSVPDTPTAELMTEFYRQLKQTGDKAKALRQAMLLLKEKYPNSPIKWAAFTLIGEAE
ncbi:MAG TPA: CHAT domain-containing protein [Oculatellaceae cyanobacterium]|jgi:CHAT domain-containing protein/Tfp pilus assembly protein PilF